MAIFNDINLTSDNFVPEFVRKLGDTGLSTSDGSVMGIGFLLGIILVSFAGSKSFGFEKSFAFSTFFSTIIAVLFIKLGYINSFVLLMNIGLFFVALFILFSKN